MAGTWNCVLLWGVCVCGGDVPVLNTHPVPGTKSRHFYHHSIADSNSSSLFCRGLSALGGRCGPEPTPLTFPLDLCGVQRATCQYLQACTLGTVSRLQRDPELRKAIWPKVTSVPGSRDQVF